MYKFQDDQLFLHTIVSHPRFDIFCTDLSSSATVVSINDVFVSGSAAVNVQELNGATNTVNPYIIKGSSRLGYKTITLSDYDNTFAYGDTITGSYDQVATVRTTLITPDSNQIYLSAMRNPLSEYSILSKQFSLISSSQTIRMVQIPSLFFGSGIQKGSVELRVLRYGQDFSGSFENSECIALLKDYKHNGELTQVYDSEKVEATSSYDNSCAGVVLYKHGIILLTGDWALTSVTGSGDYTEILPNEKIPRWYHFGERNDNNDYLCRLKFNGTTKTPVRTILAQAPMGELNTSGNPTFISYGQNPTYGMFSGSFLQPSANYFLESPKVRVANTVGDKYSEVVFTKDDPTETGNNFKRQTFLSKVILYDEKKIPIATVKLASPIRKREEDAFCTKIVLDL